MTSRLTVSIARIERTIMEILRRLKQVEGRAGRALQNSFIGSMGDAFGQGGGTIALATGSGIPAASGGVDGSATYTIKDFDPATGMWSGSTTDKVWNHAPNAIASGDVYVAQCKAGAWHAITEFC